MHLGRIYPLLQFAQDGTGNAANLEGQHLDRRGITTEAYVSVINDWRSPLITSVTQNTRMSDKFPSPLTINPGQSSSAIHVSASWIPGQSSFGLSFAPSLEGVAASGINIRLGRPPVYVTDVSFGGGDSPGQVGAVLAPTKAFSDHDYNMYLFGGPGIIPPLVNSLLDANLAALNKYLNGNPIKPPVGNDVNVAINSIPTSIHCSYAGVSPVQEGDLNMLNVNAIIDISGTINGQLGWKGINTDFAINLKKLSVMLQAHVDVHALKIQVTALQVSAKGFSVSNDVLTVLQVLVPPLAAVINNPYLVAGLLNANYNANIINEINKVLDGLVKLPSDLQRVVSTLRSKILNSETTLFPHKKSSEPRFDGRVKQHQAKDYSRWMSNDNIQSKSLSQLKLPGTHDSATHDLQNKLSLISYPDISFLWLFDYETTAAPVNGENPFRQKPYYLGPVLGNYVLERVKRVSKAQSQSTLDQLRGGVRVFDLRIYYDPADGVCYSQHGLKGSKLEDIFNQVKGFFEGDASAAELVMLQISHTNFGEHPNAVNDVTNMASQILGDYIYVPEGAAGTKHFDFNSLAGKTVASMTGGKNKVILMNTDDNDSWTFAQYFVNTAGFGASPPSGGSGLYQVSLAQALTAMDIINNVLRALTGDQEQWLLGWYAERNNRGSSEFLNDQPGPYHLVNLDWYELPLDAPSPVEVIVNMNLG